MDQHFQLKHLFHPLSIGGLGSSNLFDRSMDDSLLNDAVLIDRRLDALVNPKAI